MDPLPFLILAVLVFWLIQLVDWMLDYYKQGQAFTGSNKVSNKQWITDLKKKAKKKAKKAKR